MINDEHRILLGLYRECSSCETLSESRTSMSKKLNLNGKFYVVEEESAEGNFKWRVSDGSYTLNREEVEELYAAANLGRLLRTKS